MIGRSPRPRLHPGRHRKLPVVTESTLPPNVTASLPPLSEQPGTRPVTEALPPLSPRPDPVVQCGWCKVMGPLSQIPGSGGWYRCAKVWECVPRQLAGGLPAPLSPAGTPPLEPLPVAEPEPPVVLPPAQEAAMDRFESAHDEEAAAEVKSRSEGAVTPEAVADAPAVAAEAPEGDDGSWLDKLADASLRAAEAKFGPMPHAPIGAAPGARAETGKTPGPPVSDQGANEIAEPAPVAAETEPEDGGEGE
jgi:hypothetical protein